MIKIKYFNSHQPDQTHKVELTPETGIDSEFFIGRSPRCRIVCESPEVSRVHGSIIFVEGQYYFNDLASRSGSRVNNETAKTNHRYPLKSDDIIRLGDFILMVEAVESSTATTPTPAIANNEPPPIPTPPLPQINQQPPKPILPPQDYMPVALVSPEDMNRWNKGKIKVRCAAIIDETHDAKTYRFVADPPVLFSYQPGQFVTLNLEINGKPVKRSYSISSTPSRPHTLEITVKRVPAPVEVVDAPPGLVSNWLHDNLREGDVIEISGPSGKFTCFANPSQYLLLISAGSGITPMMSMSRWVLDTAADCDIVFFHNARTPGDIIFGRELDLISSLHPKFRLAISITRPQPGQVWSGFTGRLNEYLLTCIAPDFYQRTVYVCGPNPFMESVKDLLKRMGFPMENYYEESFGGAKIPKKSAPKEEIVSEVKTLTPPPKQDSIPVSEPKPDPPAISASPSTTLVFAKSRKEVTGNGNDSILELAEENGVEIDSSCRTGACGTCKVKKLSGQVEYLSDPDALDDSEVEQGYILTCIAAPLGRVELDA